MGEGGKLFSLIFEIERAGAAVVGIRDVVALRNDSQGSKSNIRSLFESTFVVESMNTESTLSVSKDSIPPEPFQPVITRDNDVFEGKWFVVFATTDKDSGLSHFEVKEGWGSFVVAESPYLIKNQRAKNRIQVKAIDNAGNERIEEAVFDSVSISFSKDAIYAIIIVLLTIIMSLRSLIFSK